MHHAVLMDFVPRHHRGKVNAVDSIRTFSWSGSAAAGGWLIERYGFQHTFLITAGIKLAAFLPLFPLLAYVPDGLCVPAGARTQRLLRQQQWGAEAGAVVVVAEGEPGEQGQAGQSLAAEAAADVTVNSARAAGGSSQRDSEAGSLQQPLLEGSKNS